MKKFLNILSYVLNIVLIAILVHTYFGKGINASENKIEGIKSGIVERERADIPMKIQQFEHVYGITIDSLVLTNNIEPYSGYLVTTWDLDEKQNLTTSQWAANGYKDKYKRKQKTVYVEISDIKTSGRTMNWQDNWISAYMSVKDSE